MAERAQRCETCLFWEHIADVHDDGDGDCKRHPPQLFRRDHCHELLGQWPVTIHDDWCGEWQSKSALPSENGRERQPRSAVLLWRNVPEACRRKSERRQKARFAVGSRCAAAVRPWLNGVGPRGEYDQCPYTPTRGSLCGIHARVAAAIGEVSWEQERSDTVREG